MKILTALACLAIICAPHAYADDDPGSHRAWLRWDQLVAPQGPTAAAPSADYNAARAYPPAGPSGTFQVYATRPGVHTTPGPQNWCGTTLSQADIPSTCPTGWDMWYR